MPTITVPYGRATLSATLPDERPVDLIQPREAEAAPDQLAAVQAALDTPLGEFDWAQLAGQQRVAIAINDKTRPVPHDRLLPPLLHKLEALGYAPEQITLVIATGTHPVMPPQEYPLVLPDALIERYPILCHDINAEADLVQLGTTSRGTPVTLNRHYQEADVRLVVGNVEPHQFMGFSGGVKSAVIGLAGKATINANHAMMQHPDAFQGNYDTNPMRQDVEEMGRMIGIDLALNTLLNGSKQIVAAFAGDPVAVMAAAIPRVRQIFITPVAQRYDLLIVSPGGWPKDINIYQAQKAMGHASAVMKDGGALILCAACPDGTGSHAYESWVTQPQIDSHAAVFQHFEREGFRVGPHKAFQIARDASRFQMSFISEMAADHARALLLKPMPDLQSAVDAALDGLPPDASIGVLPYGNSTVPLLEH